MSGDPKKPDPNRRHSSKPQETDHQPEEHPEVPDEPVPAGPGPSPRPKPDRTPKPPQLPGG